MAVRRRDARRRAGPEAGQRDRRLLSQPPRPCRWLAQPPWRRRAPDRRPRGLPPQAGRGGPDRHAGRARSCPIGGRTTGVELRGRRARHRARRHRRRDAARAGAARGRGARRLVSQRAQALRLRPRDAQGRLGARRADPVDRRGGPRRRHGARRRQRVRAHGARSRSRPSASRTRPPAARPAEPSPTRRAPRTGSTPHGRTRTGRRAAWTGRPSTTATSSASRRRSSASRPASATASSRVTCSGPADLQARNRNLVGGDVGGGSYRLRQVVFRPLPKLSPYRTPLGGLYLGSAATFPGGAVHGVPATPPRARRSKTADERPAGRQADPHHRRDQRRRARGGRPASRRRERPWPSSPAGSPGCARRLRSPMRTARSRRGSRPISPTAPRPRPPSRRRPRRSAGSTSWSRTRAPLAFGHLLEVDGDDFDRALAVTFTGAVNVSGPPSRSCAPPAG